MLSAALAALLVLASGCGTAPPETVVEVRGTDARSPAVPANPLAAALDRVFAAGAEGRTAIAALVVDLADGRRLYERDARRLLNPASTMKLLTAAAACSAGMLDDELSLTVSRTGPEGRALLLSGGGNPFWTLAELESLAALPAGWTGFREIRVDAGLFRGPPLGRGWMWDDVGTPGESAIGAVMVERGAFTIAVRDAGGQVEADIRGDGGLATLANRARIGPATALEVTVASTGAQRFDVVLDGTLAPGAKHETACAAPDPAAHAGALLRAALAARGLADPAAAIVAAGPEPGWTPEPGPAIRARLGDVLRRTVKDSDNAGAECVLRLLGRRRDSGAANADDGLEGIWRHLEGAGVTRADAFLADGSGVSRYGLVSAETLVRVLADMAARPEAEAFTAMLPVAGADGTLRSRMRSGGAQGRIAAKTGTLRGVSTLAGYATRPDGRRLAFAFLMQAFTGPAGPWRELQDRACAVLVETPLR